MFILNRINYVDSEFATFKMKEYYNKEFKKNNPFPEWIMSVNKNCKMYLNGIYDYSKDIWKIQQITLTKGMSVIWNWCNINYKGQQLNGYYIRILDTDGNEMSVIDFIKNGSFIEEFKL